MYKYTLPFTNSSTILSSFSPVTYEVRKKNSNLVKKKKKGMRKKKGREEREKKKERKKMCVSRESNPDLLLGRQQC